MGEGKHGENDGSAQKSDEGIADEGPEEQRTSPFPQGSYIMFGVAFQ